MTLQWEEIEASTGEGVSFVRWQASGRAATFDIMESRSWSLGAPNSEFSLFMNHSSIATLSSLAAVQGLAEVIDEELGDAYDRDAERVAQVELQQRIARSELPKNIIRAGSGRAS